MAAAVARVEVSVVKLSHAEGLNLPAYATQLAAGADLLAAITDTLWLTPGERALIPTGLQIALPPGYEGQVRPRSGLALKHGITCLNTPGTIDADYRGEIGVILANLGNERFAVERGMRIAQLVVAPVTQVLWVESVELPPTGRGSGGFGSTGSLT